MKLIPAPKVLNCCSPETDEEKKALWLAQGGTVIEYLAEQAGLTLEAYLRKEYGPPVGNEDRLNENLEKYSDILRWRKEEAIDAEETAEAVNAEGSSAGID